MANIYQLLYGLFSASPAANLQRRRSDVLRRLVEQSDGSYAPLALARLVYEDDLALSVDSILHALVTIDSVHNEIHEGEAFVSGYLVPHGAPLADDASLDVRFTAGAKSAHVVAEIDAAGDFEAYLYEAGNVTGGAALTIINLNRNSTNTATAVLAQGPTVTSPGTLLQAAFVPGGTKNFVSGASARQTVEFILKPNTTYLYRFTNRSGGTAQASAGFEWYEED